MSRNKVIVRINGAEYTLMGEETEDYLFSIANYVDKKVREVLYSNPKHSTTSAAVLTSLTLTNDLFKIKNELEMAKKSVKEPEEKSKKLQNEYDELYSQYLTLLKEFEEFKEEGNNKDQSINELKAGYDELYESFIKKGEDFEALLKENAYLKQQNADLEEKVSENLQNISNLKDQLLENQIELVQVKKDFKDTQNKKGIYRG